MSDLVTVFKTYSVIYIEKKIAFAPHGLLSSGPLHRCQLPPTSQPQVMSRCPYAFKC